MNTSISDSKQSLRYGLLVAIVVFVPTIMLTNFLITLGENFSDDAFGMLRIKSSLESLPKIASDDEFKVLVSGSSLVKDGFSPRYFDQTLEDNYQINVKSYNLGMGNMNPSFLKLFARRAREVFEQHETAADLVILEFNPFYSTKQTEIFRPYVKEQINAVLMSSSELLTVAKEDPSLFLRMAVTKYLRNGISAQAITGGLKSMASETREFLGSIDEDHKLVLQKQFELAQQFNDVVAQAHPDTKKSLAWNAKTQGGLIDLEDLPKQDHPLIKELVDVMQHPDSLALNKDGLVSCCDGIELKFSDKLLADFEETLVELQKISTNLEVVVFPINYEILRPTPEAEKRLHDFLTMIATKYNVKVRNYHTHPEMDSSMFYDTAHLSMYKGRKKFSEMLANDISIELLSNLGGQISESLGVLN